MSPSPTSTPIPKRDRSRSPSPPPTSISPINHTFASSTRPTPASTTRWQTKSERKEQMRMQNRAQMDRAVASHSNSVTVGNSGRPVRANGADVGEEVDLTSEPGSQGSGSENEGEEATETETGTETGSEDGTAEGDTADEDEDEADTRFDSRDPTLSFAHAKTPMNTFQSLAPVKPKSRQASSSSSRRLEDPAEGSSTHPAGQHVSTRKSSRRNDGTGSKSRRSRGAGTGTGTGTGTSGLTEMDAGREIEEDVLRGIEEERMRRKGDDGQADVEESSVGDGDEDAQAGNGAGAAVKLKSWSNKLTPAGRGGDVRKRPVLMDRRDTDDVPIPASKVPVPPPPAILNAHNTKTPRRNSNRSENYRLQSHRLSTTISPERSMISGTGRSMKSRLSTSGSTKTQNTMMSGRTGSSSYNSTGLLLSPGTSITTLTSGAGSGSASGSGGKVEGDEQRGRRLSVDLENGLEQRKPNPSDGSRKSYHPFADTDVPPGIMIPHLTNLNSPQAQYAGSINGSSTITGVVDIRKQREEQEEKQREQDRARLEQLGYSESLGRDYGFWASFSVGFVNIGGALQGPLFGIFTTFNYGGPRMILIMWPIAAVALTLLTASLSELASAYPIAGAMSSWVFLLRRKAKGQGHERFYSWHMASCVIAYHIGVMCLISWQTARLVNETIHLANDKYIAARWCTLLFSLVLMILMGLVGTSKWGRHPRFWIMSCLYIVVIWGIVCVSLVSTRAHKSAASLLFQAPFRNESGFDSKAYVYLVGWILCTIATGSDACAHLAEETKNPARVLPLAMVGSIIASYVFGYVCIFIILLAIDPDWVIDISQHGFPTGQILERSLGHKSAVVILSFCILALFLQSTAQLQASSRFVWALARDQAVPFSKRIHQVNKNRIPVLATWIVLALSFPMTFAIWPAPAISYSLLSVTGGTFCLLSYSIPVLLYLRSDIDLKHEYRSNWTLRRFSKPIGYTAVLFSAAIIAVMTLPTARPITAETLSWSPIVTPVALALSWLSWKFYGNRHYSGPIRAITKWTAGAEIDLQTTLKNSDDSSRGHSPGTRADPGQTETDFFSPTIQVTSTLPFTNIASHEPPQDSPTFLEDTTKLRSSTHTP